VGGKIEGLLRPFPGELAGLFDFPTFTRPLLDMQPPTLRLVFPSHPAAVSSFPFRKRPLYGKPKKFDLTRWQKRFFLALAPPRWLLHTLISNPRW